MPLFSIVIPTRKRAHLLRFALRSALQQTFIDYEIIVSNNGSDEDVHRVVAELGNGKVKYFRTDEVLPMPDHWEFALSHARGEWITFLTDRSVLLRNCLETVWRAIEETEARVISWRWGDYYHGSCYEAERANQLDLPTVSGKVTEEDPRSGLRDLFDMRGGPALPKMFNSVAHKSVIETVCHRKGRFFSPPNPDYSAVLAALSVVDRYAVIDDILMLSGITRDSTGYTSGFNRGESTQKFIREFGDDGIYHHIPSGFPVLVIGTLAENLLGEQAQMPDLLAPYRLNWRRFFLRCYNELKILRANGVDVRQDMNVVLSTARRQRAEVWLPVLAAVAYGKVRGAIVSVLRQHKPFSRMRGWVQDHRMRRQGIHRVSGKEAGFNDILECAEKVDAWRTGAGKGRPLYQL
jgi:glycosyltransferase involved in cell wall biosynthesis